MALQFSPYKVYNRTFLSSVRWLFGYTAEEENFVERFIREMERLSFAVLGKEAKAVMMKKQGITVLANSEVLFINCSSDVYKGFETLRPEIQSFLAVLERLGVQEIKNINCVKENLFKVDKDRIKSLSESQFANILFKENLASQPFYADSRDGIQAIVTRSFSDSVTESTMQMLVTVSWGIELSLSAATDKLMEIDKASYDVWTMTISEGVKQVMEK